MGNIKWIDNASAMSLVVMFVFIGAMLFFYLVNLLCKYFMSKFDSNCSGLNLFKLISIDLDLADYKLKGVNSSVMNKIYQPNKSEQTINIFEKRLESTSITNLVYILNYSILVDHKVHPQDNLRFKLITFFILGWVGFILGIITTCLMFSYPSYEVNHQIMSICLQYLAYLVIIILTIAYIGWSGVMEKIRFEAIRIVAKYVDEQTLSRINRLMLINSFCINSMNL